MVIKMYGKEENVASDSEMTEVISKEAIIRAWRHLRHGSRQSLTLHDRIWSRDVHPIVIYKNITRPIVVYKKIGAEG
jgi:hypothetical protein